jgi:integrase
VSIALHKRNVRDTLKPRREPYWAAPLGPGRFIGFRVIDGKPGSWIARARDPNTGKQQYNALKDATDYDSACKAAREWFANMDEGVNTKDSFTVEDACKEYVDDRRREKGDACADDAEWRFTRGGIYGTAFGRTEVAKLRAVAIRNWRQSLMLEDDEKRQMTKAGTNRMVTTLRAALNLAVANDRVPESCRRQWRGGKKGKLPQYEGADSRREIFLDIAQRRALLEATTGSVRDLIEAALWIGARPGELAKATRAQFDAQAKTLKLFHRKGNGTVRERHVVLTGAALALFERLAKSKLPGALLLTRDDGQPWTRIEWSRRINAAAEAAVVKDDAGEVLKDDKGKEVKLPPGVCLYSCRHTYISQAILDGLTTLDVARLTGTSLAMIDKHYGHLAQDSVRERLAKVQML